MTKISKAAVWLEAGIIKPIDVLDVVMTAPAGFVVVNTTITADEETAGAEIETRDVIEVVMTDPAGFVVVNTTTSADEETAGERT